MRGAPTVELLYRPVLIRGQEAANTYRCYPIAGDRILGKQALLHQGEDATATARINAAVLSKAFTDLTYAHSEGNRVRLMVPVNAMALAESEASTILVATFKELSEPLRKFVVIEVFDFPDDVHIDSLADMTIPLLPFFDYYLALPIAGEKDFTVYATTNYFGISIDLENMNGSEGEMAKTLGIAAASAEMRNLKLYIQGIASDGMRKIVERHDPFAKDGPVFGADISVLGKMAEAAETA